MSFEQVKFGRIYVPDSRDNDFLVSSVLPGTIPDIRRKYWWNAGWQGDQGDTSQCVAYSWMHWIEDGPMIQDQLPAGRPQPLFNTTRFYRECQLRDAWPGTSYDGTSVRAGAKILKEMGAVKEYRWAKTLDEVIACLTLLGPVVVGTTWYSGMTDLRPNRVVRTTGRNQGGHAYVLNGFDKDSELIRLKNSWGSKWGDNGHAYIRFGDFEKLISDWGEVCVAFPQKLSDVPLLENLSPPVDGTPD